MTVTTLHELIALHECDDPVDTASAVMSALAVPAKWREVFFPLLRDECRRCYRSAARLVEQGREQGDDATGSPSTTVGTRRSLLDHRFYNGTKWVTWGEATVADHEGRIAYQMSFRAGIDNDIELHRKAIDDITAAKASCLADLGEWGHS